MKILNFNLSHQPWNIDHHFESRRLCLVSCVSCLPSCVSCLVSPVCCSVSCVGYLTVVELDSSPDDNVQAPTLLLLFTNMGCLMTQRPHQRVIQPPKGTLLNVSKILDQHLLKLGKRWEHISRAKHYVSDRSKVGVIITSSSNSLLENFGGLLSKVSLVKRMIS